MPLSLKKAVIVSIALENEGFPGMFNQLYRPQERPRSPVENVESYEARMHFEKSCDDAAKKGDRSFVHELAGPPTCKGDFALVAFKENAAVRGFNAASEIWRTIREETPFKPIVVLDMANVRSIDEMFIAGIVSLRRVLGESERKLCMIEVAPEPLKKLRTCRMEMIVPIFSKFASLEYAYATGRV